MSLSYPRQPNVTPHSKASELGRRDRECVCVCVRLICVWMYLSVCGFLAGCVCVSECEGESERDKDWRVTGRLFSKADLDFVLYSPTLCLLSKETLSLSVSQYANIHTYILAKEKNAIFFSLPPHWIILGWRRSIKRHIFIICHHIHFYANEKPVPDENLFSVPQTEVSGDHVLFVFGVCL